MKTFPSIEVKNLRNNLDIIQIEVINAANNLQVDEIGAIIENGISKRSKVIIEVKHVDANIYRMQAFLVLDNVKFTGNAVMGTNPSVLVKDAIIQLLLGEY